MSEKPEKLVLIDGHSILNRAFFGVPDLTNYEGLHTNAVYGFLNILFKILEEEQAQYLAVAFDLSAPTFRHKMFDGYKGTRKPMADELRQQVPVMQDVLRAMGVPIVMQEGLEADDIIGTLSVRAEAAGLTVSVVSGDRDLLQLATKNVCIRIPKTKKTGTEIEDYYEDDVKERYLVSPKEFVDVKALMGDSSDNIPGVSGIGEKTATSLIARFGSIENLHEHIDEVTQKRARENFIAEYETAVLSKQLAKIVTDADVPFELEDARIGNLYTEEAYVWMKRLEFKNILARFDRDALTNPLEGHMQMVTDRASFEKMAEALTGAKQLAVSLLMYKDLFLGVGYAAEKETLYFAKAEEKTQLELLAGDGGLTKPYLYEQTRALCEKAEMVLSFDVKALLHATGLCKDEQGKEKAEGWFDATVAAYLLNPLSNSYSYDNLANEYAGVMLPSMETLFSNGKSTGKKVKREELSDEAMCDAACASVYALLATKQPLLERLEEQQMLTLFETVEMPLVFTLADMEREGILVKEKELSEYGQQLTGRIAELEQGIYDAAGETFNINSPKQLGVILFEKLQMPYAKKTKTGYSTAADVLEKLSPEYPIVSDILEYRTLSKLKSTYADGLAAYIEEDGRIRTCFNQTITATGRLSSTEPNLQNIPVRMELGRMIRKVFVPREGCLFLDADYSQIELRVLAHMSGDANLIEAYQKAEDIHRMTASQVFHVPFDEVTDLQRRNAKAVNFGIVYGISSFGLSEDLSITRKEAQEYINSYFETYPGIKTFLDGLVENAKKDGYVTTMFGRRRPVPELSSGNYMQRSFGERIAMNSPIQGTAADIIKIAMIRVHDRLLAEGLRSRLILQVHDELLIETYEEEKEAVEQLLHEEMLHAADLSVSLEADVHAGSNWYEAK